ncbi:hypothetical protein ACB098_04G142900 [Castanea mollissima]
MSSLKLFMSELFCGLPTFFKNNAQLPSSDKRITFKREFHKSSSDATLESRVVRMILLPFETFAKGYASMNHTSTVQTSSKTIRNLTFIRIWYSIADSSSWLIDSNTPVTKDLNCSSMISNRPRYVTSLYAKSLGTRTHTRRLKC